nr:hypothetical protein [Tanacetum cinerariifolium]
MAYTPQQNRVVEQSNRTLVESARTMLIFSTTLLFLWADVVATAIYNRTTRKFRETVNVKFDEFLAMVSEQHNLDTISFENLIVVKVIHYLERMHYKPLTTLVEYSKIVVSKEASVTLRLPYNGRNLKYGEAMINSIKHGEHPLPVLSQVSLAGTTPNVPPPLKDKPMWTIKEKKIQKINRLARSVLIQGLPNDFYSLIDSNDPAKELWDALERHMRGSMKKKVMVTSNPFSLVTEKTKVSKGREKVVVHSESERSDDEDISDLKNITTLLAKAFNQKKYYIKPTNNNLRTSSASTPANKKPDDSDQELSANMVFMAKMENILSDSEESSSSAKETIVEGLFVDNDDDQEIFLDAIKTASETFDENHVVSQNDYDESRFDHNESEDKDNLITKFNQKIAKYLDNLSSVRRRKHSSVIWKKKWPSNSPFADLSSLKKFLETVWFSNDDFVVIDGYGHVDIGSMTIKKVYYVKDGVDFLTGDCSSNLYTISLNDIALNSSVLLLAKASSSQSWLWHQRLSHLNFAPINNLLKNNLVRVPRIEAIRLFPTYAAYKDFMVFQLDVKTMFLNGILKEEAYVGQHPGFVSKQYPNHVYALDKALYGLKQAPQAWLQVNKFSNGIFINQSKYNNDILKRCGMENCDTVPTPMVEQVKLRLDLVRKPVGHTNYHSMIGSLVYLTSIIEFGDSYKAPTNSGLVDPIRKDAEQSGRTITLTTNDMQKKKNDVKARTTLLLSLPDEHRLRFSKYKTTKELWPAILKTFGGNEATKKRKKNLLKQQYGNFKAEGTETLEQTFNRLQVIVSQLQFMDVEVEKDDLNQKFLTSLAWRNRNDLDSMSLDDLYNHLKVYEAEVPKKSNSNSVTPPNWPAAEY